MRCSYVQCLEDINFLGKRKRHINIFCTRDCGEKFKALMDSEKRCSKCSEFKNFKLFSIRKKSNYYYISEVCNECYKRIKKIIINFQKNSSGLSESFVHTDINYYTYENGMLKILSKKDSKEYLYPLSNLLKVEVLH